MKFKFTVAERLHLLGLLPKEGSLVTLRVIADLRMELAFSDAEIAALGLVQDEKGTRWNAKADAGKEIEVSAVAQKTIAETLTALDRAEKLTFDLLPLAERFMEPAAEKVAS